ncbi:hypothetical protein MNV49_005508 [Pseudohyphozyma bogoriensis]|nr:hypothetical protein MNV49_005508 [Pseudohyphozyma bogoriensis]
MSNTLNVSTSSTPLVNEYDTIGGVTAQEKEQLDVLKEYGAIAGVLSKMFLEQVQGDRLRAEATKKRKAAKEEKKRLAAANGTNNSTDASRSSGRTATTAATKTANGATKRKAGDTNGAAKKVKTENGAEVVDGAVANAEPEQEAVQDDDGDDESDVEGGDEDVMVLRKQPKLITGATMKDYQLAGTQWLIRLCFNEFSGILADEMGLGKTIQTIALIAWLREQKEYSPILVVCPASVLDNWVSEFNKFAPAIPVLRYYGDQKERKKLLGDMTKPHYKPNKLTPVVITTYQMIGNDRNPLSKVNYDWLIIDEGHRLKNIDCKLMRDLKEYRSKQRLILTGTPLQNDVMELYSLLSFLNPHIFKNKDVFKNLFKFDSSSTTTTAANTPGGSGTATPTTQEATEAKSKFIADQLAAILHPFMWVLRRMKDDVEISLPPKKEYVLTAPQTPQQLELTEQITNNNLRNYLIGQQTGEVIESTNNKAARKAAEAAQAEKLSESEWGVPLSARKPKRGVGRPRKSYVEATEEEFLTAMEEGYTPPIEQPTLEDVQALGKAHALKTATSRFNGAKLQNACAQLRKVANHPFNFDWPVDPNTGRPVIDERLLEASGKMLLLDRLLRALFEKGHRVLIFSQFTTMLDIIEDWAIESKKWPVCRIDGSTNVDARRTSMRYFNREDGPNDCNIFLLTTRAGGVGINLTGADTVIFFDSDWNPQQDLQAMARAHRIGQTKPVLIFRLVTANSIEKKILERAHNKRKLEALVIGKGKFTGQYGELDAFANSTRRRKGEDSILKFVQELTAQSNEEVKVATAGSELLTDKQLEVLLDRSEETMRSTAAWKGAEATSFEVVETNEKEEADETLAAIFGADGEETLDDKEDKGLF